jgi:hypothetical protein
MVEGLFDGGCFAQDASKISVRVTYNYADIKGAYFQFDGPAHELLDILAKISDKFDIHNLRINWWTGGKELRINHAKDETGFPT